MQAATKRNKNTALEAMKIQMTNHNEIKRTVYAAYHARSDPQSSGRINIPVGQLMYFLLVLLCVAFVYTHTHIYIYIYIYIYITGAISIKKKILSSRGILRAYSAVPWLCIDLYYHNTRPSIHLAAIDLFLHLYSRLCLRNCRHSLRFYGCSTKVQFYRVSNATYSCV